MAKINSPLASFVRKYYHGILLVAIIALAVFFRYWHLSSLPPGLHPDEAANGLDVFRIFKGDLRPLYATNGPRESLFFYIQAIFVATMGNTILALRMAPALIGVLGTITTYLWMRSWFGKRAGLIAGFLMAVTPWGVTITRDGFRASMTPLMVTLTLWLYTLGFKTGKRKWFILAGVSMGAGLYTYLSFRLFPAALLAVAVPLYIWRRPFFNNWFKPVMVSLAAMTVVLIPMIIFGIQHPGDIGARAAGTSVFNKSLNGGKPLNALLDSSVKTILMFNVKGDENFRHNLGGAPALNIFVGIMFVLGFLIVISNLYRPKYFAMFALLGSMLLPVALTAEGIPHFLRAIGALPIALGLATIGICYMLDRWYQTFPINSAARTSGMGIMIVLLLLTGYQSYAQYFVAWAGSSETYNAYSEDAVGVANFMLKHNFDGQRYAVIDGYSDKVLEYLTHNKVTYTRLEPSDIAGLPVDGNNKQFLIAKGSIDESVKTFRSKFPGGRLSPQLSNFDNQELFMVYEVRK